MSILLTDIQRGWLYTTESDQERLVLGWTQDGRVVYTMRGGNALNPFTGRQTCSEERFANACIRKQLLVDDDALSTIMRNTNAGDIVEHLDRPAKSGN